MLDRLFELPLNWETKIEVEWNSPIIIFSNLPELNFQHFWVLWRPRRAWLRAATVRWPRWSSGRPWGREESGVTRSLRRWSSRWRRPRRSSREGCRAGPGFRPSQPFQVSRQQIFRFWPPVKSFKFKYWKRVFICNYNGAKSCKFSYTVEIIKSLQTQNPFSHWTTNLPKGTIGKYDFVSAYKL